MTEHELRMGAWTLVSERADTRLYQRADDSHDITLLARTRFPAPPVRVHGVVTDYERFAEFIPHVAQSVVLSHDTWASRVYQRLDLPAPIADRHYTLESTERGSRPAAAYYLVTWHLAPLLVPAGADRPAIVPEMLDGFWELRPTGGGKATDATYSIRFDPGGQLPHWLATPAIQRYVLEVIEAVRQRAEAAPHRP